jgi:hypothetical protein
MNARTVLVAAGWSFIISSVILQVLYVTPTISWSCYVILVLASVMCGILIVDLKDIILSYFLVLLFSFSVTTFMLGILPSVTGMLQSGFMTSDLIVSFAILMIVKSTFPGIWVFCLLAGILGGGIGETIEPFFEEEDYGVQK